MNHFQRYVAEEYAEDFWEGRIARRDALKVLAAVTGSLVLAESFLAACAPQDSVGLPPAVTTTPTSPPTIGASASTDTPSAGPSPSAALVGTVSPDDPDIQVGPIEIAVGDATILAYLARPIGEDPASVVLVCHENRGLTDHIRDVARRLAKAGYVALAVDLLSRLGGTDAVGSDNAPGALTSLPPEQFVQDFAGGLEFLRSQPYADVERAGMVGFCFGGGVTWLVATRLPSLKAAVPFYGPHPPVADVPGIQAAVLAVYAGRDERINSGIPEIEAAMQQQGKIYEKVVYPDVDHAFHNDTGSRYDPPSAQDAWRRTLEWFDRYLRAS
jgi:carboxymethylenebutenolidase